MASEVPPETIEQQIDQAILAVTAAQSNALSKQIKASYRAGSNAVRDTTGLTNVQKNAIKNLTAESFGHLSEFNRNVGEQIKDKARTLIADGKGYKDVSREVKEYAESIFKGSEHVVIDNRGKTRTVLKVSKDGTIKAVEKEITRPYVTNVNAYSEMVGRTSIHTAWEQGRASEYQRMGFTFWRYISAGDERTRPWHMSLHGQVFEYGTEQSDLALQVKQEPHCRCRAVVFFDDPKMDTPQAVFEEQKSKAGLYWDDDTGEWKFKD
jgi:SPP1 gp7 family putative phage head morphogenesis protein